MRFCIIVSEAAKCKGLKTSSIIRKALIAKARVISFTLIFFTLTHK